MRSILHTLAEHKSLTDAEIDIDAGPARCCGTHPWMEVSGAFKMQTTFARSPVTERPLPVTHQILRPCSPCKSDAGLHDGMCMIRKVRLISGCAIPQLAGAFTGFLAYYFGGDFFDWLRSVLGSNNGSQERPLRA